MFKRNAKIKPALFDISLSILLVITLSACQSTPEKVKAQPIVLNYSHYYLWIKTLPETELRFEIAAQKKLLAAIDTAKNHTQNHTQSKLIQKSFTPIHAKIMLLHSLPNSPIYQPYAAKTLLNNVNFLDSDSEHNLSNNNPDHNGHYANGESFYNLAFMLLLKDQLNAQLKLLKTQAAIQTKAKQQYESQGSVIIQLEEQLLQLKKIEDNLSQHQQLNK